MKKIFAVALALALCFTLAPSASAIDTEALESRTTEGLYDRSDAFDLARQPGLLYQVKPLHLWTVGSGYSSPDEHGAMDSASDSFVVGVGKALGPGSFAVFFETNNQKREVVYQATQFLAKEFYTPGGGAGSDQYYSWDARGNYGGDAFQYPNFDGVVDMTKDAAAWYRDNHERTEYNFSAAYSWDATDTFAVGLQYEPHWVDEEETIDITMGGIGIQRSHTPDINDYPFSNPWGSFDSTFQGMPAMWFWGVSSGARTAELFGADRHCWLDNIPPVYEGANWGGTFNTVWYPDVAHTTVMNSDLSESFDGKREGDVTAHPFELQGHWRPSDSWDILVGVGYATVEGKDTVQGIYNLNTTYSGSDPEGIYWDDYQNFPVYGAPPGPFPVQYDSASYVADFDTTFTVGGSLQDTDAVEIIFPTVRGAVGGGTGSNRMEPAGPHYHADDALNDDNEGDRWSLFVSPTYFMNDMHSFRLDLGYGAENGDFNGGLYGRLDFSASLTADINGEETYYDVDRSTTAVELWDGTSTGDYEEVSYFVEPRWYVNFDKVHFSAGLGWYYSEYEWDGVMRLDKTTNIVWSNDSGPYFYDDTQSGSAIASYTGLQGFRGEVTETVWRAPVAVMFDVTEKLTLRAGASYYRTTTEVKREDSQEFRMNETWQEFDENGIQVDLGPAEHYPTSSASGTDELLTYDPWDRGCAFSSTEKITDDGTTYQLGLGYYFTENLQFDLMFAGESGYVDSSQLFGSFTIIFP